MSLEVYDELGNVISDENFVFQKWSTEFENLCNTEQFDDQFYPDILNGKLFLEDRMLDPLFEENPSLNISVIRSEVEKVVYSAKNGKSIGYDKIPYEVLKFHIIIDVLYALFNLCFDTGILPSIWKMAMIAPIPKDSTKDKPLNYRGISLLSVVSKLYSAELNNRLLGYLEDERLLAEEQKDRSVTSSIPTYFQNSEPPIICYKYNKPIRNTVFNFNKLVSDLDFHANTPES